MDIEYNYAVIQHKGNVSAGFVIAIFITSYDAYRFAKHQSGGLYSFDVVPVHSSHFDTIERLAMDAVKDLEDEEA